MKCLVEILLKGSGGEHFWISSMHFRCFIINGGALHLKKLDSPSPKDNLCQFDFQISTIYFHYLIIISPWKRVWPFIWTNLNSLYPRMICAKFDWNWSNVSEEEDENVKSLQTDRQMDNKQQVIRKTNLSFQLRWATKNA